MPVLYRSINHVNRFNIFTVVRVSSIAQNCQNAIATTKSTNQNRPNTAFGQSSFLHTYHRPRKHITSVKLRGISSKNSPYFSIRHCSGSSQVPNSNSGSLSSVTVYDDSAYSSQTLLSDIDTSNTVTQLAEPTLVSQGLGGYWPPGLVQNILQYFHVELGLPWWGSIVTLTVIIRFLMFPIYVKARKNAIIMSNNMPNAQKLQQEMLTAAQSGDLHRVEKAQAEMMSHMKNQSKAMMVPLMQAPVFISMFWGLRPMANLPIESMKTGGILWFPDLTVVEPFYGLPLLTSLTLLAVIEVGGDVDMKNQPYGKQTKMLIQGMALLSLPILCNFPSAMLVYWLTSNTITLVQVALFQIPSVQKALNFPEKIKHVIDIAPMKERKGFMEQYKELVKNEELKKAHTISEIKRLDALEAEKKRTEERLAYVRKLEALKINRENVKEKIRANLKNSQGHNPENRKQND